MQGRFHDHAFDGAIRRVADAECLARRHLQPRNAVRVVGQPQHLLRCAQPEQRVDGSRSAITAAVYGSMSAAWVRQVGIRIVNMTFSGGQWLLAACLPTVFAGRVAISSPVAKIAMEQPDC